MGKIIRTFQEFLLSFNIDTDMRVSAFGQIQVKVMEYPYNLRLKGYTDVSSHPIEHKYAKQFSYKMLDILMFLYHNMHLRALLDSSGPNFIDYMTMVDDLDLSFRKMTVESYRHQTIEGFFPSAD